MSIAAAQASKFYEQVMRDGHAFTFIGDDGMLVFPIRDIEVVPFWSSHSRMLTVQRRHEKYRVYTIDEIPLAAFIQTTLPQLSDEGIHVGVNWTGKRLVGYDLSIESLAENLNYWCDKLDVDV